MGSERVRGGEVEAIVSDERAPAQTSYDTVRRSSTLMVGAVGDPAEREADDMARSVVARLRTDVVEAPIPAEHDGDGDRPRVQRRSVSVSTPNATPGNGRIRRSAVGLEGGAVDSDTESRIRASRGGGRPLDPDTNKRMGDAFGADFSNVRVHTGSQSTELNNRIQAKAFTLGSDVYFRDGAPDANTPGGQELLAHELTHTIQQGGAARRTAASTSTAPSAARIRRAVGPVVQRTAATTLLAADVLKPDATDPTKVDDTSTGLSSVKIGIGDALDVDFSVELTGKSLGGAHVQVNTVGTNELASRGFQRYVKKSAVEAKGSRGTPEGKTTGDKVDKTSGKIGAFVGVVPEINDAQDAFKKNGGSVSNDMEAGMGVSAGTADTIAMLTGLASAIAAFNAKGASGSDKAGAVLSGMSSVGGGAKGISGIVDKGGGGTAATAGAQGVAGFADAFAGVKDTFFAIKHIVELANKAAELNDKEKFKASMEIITEAMSAAKSGVSSAKAFMDLWGGGAGAPLVNAVPGLGIALSAVDIIIRAVDLVSALITRNDMQTRKRSIKTGAALGGAQGTSLKKDAEAFIKSIDAKHRAGQPVTPDEEAKYAQYEEYLLAKGLQYISSKRANRAILKISVAMGKIAGDVATLGGASAPVGVGIKAGAMALDVGASVFRRFKQWGRDKKAAKEESTGAAVTGFFGMFNANKSTAKKLEGYNRMVDKIFELIVKVTVVTDMAEKAAAAEQVSAFVGAMGLSIKQMDAKKGDPAQLRMSMIEAMKKRE